MSLLLLLLLHRPIDSPAAAGTPMESQAHPVYTWQMCQYKNIPAAAPATVVGQTSVFAAA